VLLGISGALGWLLSPAFFATVVAYVVATLVYSLWLKSVPAVDIVLLASFFVLRIFAGGLATQVEVSSWLLATSFFAFLSIAAAKRVVELSVMAESSEGGFVSGRGYVSTDLGVVQTVGVGVGISSALLLGLYVETGIAASNFSSPQLLWLTVPLWIYWVLRFWIIVSRGKVDHDPIEFVLKDWISYAVVVALALLLVIAQ
jgi:4-hydroxybenzoate polyprenyltransferase